MSTEWIRHPKGNTAVVFVHGILSNSTKCWTSADGAYWPDLLTQRDDLQSVGILTFSYQTDIFSGNYSISDAADALREGLRIENVTASRNLVFVCHSMGGLVVRRYLVSRQSELVESGNCIGLFLVASPSLGSEYANYLAEVGKVMGNRQANALRFAQSNTWLNDLDRDFVRLKESRKLSIIGRELIEEKAFARARWIRLRQIVEPFSAARYFADPIKIPKSDHFSIAAPTSQKAFQAELLCQFVTDVRTKGISETADTGPEARSTRPATLAPPSAQYALLQTDIVDSTRLNEQLGDAAMSAIWEMHDRLSRDLLPKWRGRELDRTDGFLLLFTTAPDAVGYALAYHQQLAALSVPVKARAGLHVGPLTFRENPSADVALGARQLELDGVAIPTTTRVMSLAKGGQTLLTAQAKVALGPTTLRLQGHGYWRMKGLEEPVELFEVGDADAPFTPPPDSDKVYRVLRRNDLWVPLAQLRHNLPAERDRFIGRKDALQELKHRIDAGARLVSVLGAGGTGKTRFVQRFGWTWLGDFAGGVWFCDLSQARSLDGIALAVAQGLEVPLGSADPVTQIGSAIAGRGACLVILDNFEQVSRFGEQTVGQWLNRAAEARFIVTTREVLGIAGEEAMAMAPLAHAEGATLFLQRASAARPDFNPGPEDLDAIDPLVKLLDGLPLAIELAAARVRLMSPPMLLQRMSERFRLLASTHGRPDRQATLQHAFDWSWDLLSPAEKTALAQLSVFEGGFTLRAAEALLDLTVCDDTPWPTDVVQSLVEKSLVRTGDSDRFDLLVTVKEYAAGHLGGNRGSSDGGAATVGAAQARHWRYFAAMDEAQAVAGGSGEIDNLVVACRRAAAFGDGKSAVGALVGAWAALRLCGPFRLGVDLANSVRNVPGLHVRERAVVEWVAGSALYAWGKVAEARHRLDAGLAFAREANDRATEARLLCTVGDLLTTDGHLEKALENLTRALALGRELGERSLQCKAYNGLGALANDRGKLDEARAHYEAALVLARGMGDKRWEGGLVGNLGILLHGQGRLDDAREHYDKAVELARETGDRRWEGNNRCNLGLLYHELGNQAEARSQFEAALVVAQDLGHARLACTVLCNLGIVLEAEGLLAQAQEHYEKAVATAGELGDRRAEGQFRRYLGRLYARLGRFGEARDCLAAGEALLRDVSDGLSLGLLLCSQSEAEHLAGNTQAARTALARAEALLMSAGVQANSELGREVEQTRQRMNS